MVRSTVFFVVFIHYLRVELGLRYKAVLRDLVGVRLKLDVALEEKHVVDLVLAKHAVAGVVVMHSRHIRE